MLSRRARNDVPVPQPSSSSTVDPCPRRPSGANVGAHTVGHFWQDGRCIFCLMNDVDKENRIHHFVERQLTGWQNTVLPLYKEYKYLVDDNIMPPPNNAPKPRLPLREILSSILCTKRKNEEEPEQSQIQKKVKTSQWSLNFLDPPNAVKKLPELRKKTFEETMWEQQLYVDGVAPLAFTQRPWREEELEQSQIQKKARLMVKTAQRSLNFLDPPNAIKKLPELRNKTFEEAMGEQQLYVDGVAPGPLAFIQGPFAATSSTSAAADL